MCTRRWVASQYGLRQRDHDDLVLSLALGAWFILYGEIHLTWGARDLAVLSSGTQV